MYEVFYAVGETVEAPVKWKDKFSGRTGYFGVLLRSNFLGMFVEPHYSGRRSGSIEVVCGCMFSGKTEELIRRLKRAKIANQEVEIFKPLIDVRYDERQVVSHDANSIPSIPVSGSSEIQKQRGRAAVIGVDEAQFFDMELVEVCQTLAAEGVRVIIAGLDMDFRGAPFGPIPQLLAIADYITKVHAICMRCGALATHSYRKTNGQTQVLVGEKNIYEARCRTCFNMGAVLEL